MSQKNICVSTKKFINIPTFVQNSGVKISEVTYSDIHGSSATQVAVNFDCSSSNPCTGIGLQDIKLTYGGEPAESSCKHADGSVNGVVEPPSCL